MKRLHILVIFKFLVFLKAMETFSYDLAGESPMGLGYVGWGMHLRRGCLGGGQNAAIPAAPRTLTGPQDSKVPAQSELPSVVLTDLCSTKIRKALVH